MTDSIEINGKRWILVRSELVDVAKIKETDPNLTSLSGIIRGYDREAEQQGLKIKLRVKEALASNWEQFYADFYRPETEAEAAASADAGN